MVSSSRADATGRLLGSPGFLSSLGCLGALGGRAGAGVVQVGQLTFGTASVAALLTGVTPMFEAPAKSMTFDEHYAEINTRTAGVRAGAEVPAEDIYRQLAAKYAEKRPLVEYGTVHRLPVADSVTFGGTGRFVGFDSLRTVDVPFSYTRDGITSQGVVTSWEAGGHGGFVILRRTRCRRQR
ncbi:hypothetical protein Aca07nite_37420 [Actinoplanes capillaceus]|uniref:Uncharacterized protein n=1 Tax=Actinoplanes campanulatus TaxID=113559 RepID=A0ABQ3WJP4_9ACTN|nr:hypothetical protein Aca07nite_37420 [Actinoplanes capillaceus]